MKRTPLTRKTPLRRSKRIYVSTANPPVSIPGGTTFTVKPKPKRRWIKYDALDQLFGKFIRLRDGKCQFCGRSDRRLEAAHMFGRGKHSTRYDPENVYAMCGGPHEKVCHRYLDTHTTEKLAWLKQRIGAERYEALELKSNTTMPGRTYQLHKLAVRTWLRNELTAMGT